LGSGGVIGDELANALMQYADKVRLVSRNPRKVQPGNELFPADLTDAVQAMAAVRGAEVVYLTVGLPYRIEIWTIQWPRIMTNVINACKEHAAKLVFFDNVYLYGKVDGWMTEETPVNPSSKKGEVRAKLDEQLFEEVKRGNLQALIVRSADFYGPNAVNTMVVPMVFERLKKGKRAQWVANDQVKHSMTFTPDAGKATALLGNTKEAYSQVWHLPTDRNALTGEEFIGEVAGVYGVRPRHSVLSRSMVRMAGLFNRDAGESVEMLYQLEYDYLFDSSKFEGRFFAPTAYVDGIRETAQKI
jgi:nucleoside-diphosphate-sugar epimerase